FFKMPENHFVYAAELLDFILPVCGCGEQRHLPPAHDRGRMFVKREHRRRAADFVRTLYRALHQRTVSQMYAVKITQRDGARGLMLFHVGTSSGNVRFYHRKFLWTNRPFPPLSNASTRP